MYLHCMWKTYWEIIQKFEYFFLTSLISRQSQYTAWLPDQWHDVDRNLTSNTLVFIYAIQAMFISGRETLVSVSGRAVRVRLDDAY